MVVALVQKCAREAKAKGYDPPTNLGYLLQEFFDFYGNQLNYASTGGFIICCLLQSTAEPAVAISLRSRVAPVFVCCVWLVKVPRFLVYCSVA